jgi:hypothetical protein
MMVSSAGGKVRWWTTTEHWCASAEAGDFWDHVPENAWFMGHVWLYEIGFTAVTLGHWMSLGYIGFMGWLLGLLWFTSVITQKTS